MTQVHLHLLISHLPVFGSILGAFVLGFGLLTKSNQTKTAAYMLFIIAALGAGVAYFTGEGAAEAVEDVLGVDEKMISQHEDFALFALIGLIVLGIASLVALYVTYKKTAITKMAAVVTLFIALISFTLVARTGYIGGQIRHTETGNEGMLNTGTGEKEDKKDD